MAGMAPWLAAIRFLLDKKFMESISCNLCGGNHTKLLYTLADFYLDRPDLRVQLKQCCTCGLVYQDPRPTVAEIGQHYPDDYEPYTNLNKELPSGLLGRAIQYGLQKRVNYITRYKAQGRLLDIGCSTGIFLMMMRRAGQWQVNGVEINARAAQLAKEQRGLDVFPGRLEEAAFADQSFDAVTMWDVLEHVHDPLATLTEIYRILKPGGLVLARVPNLASWDARLFQRYWAGLDAPRHLYLFTPETLVQCIERAGFQMKTLDSKIGGYVTFVLSVKFVMTAYAWPMAVRDLVLKVLYHPISRLLSVPFFYGPAILGKGPLLVAVAQKAGLDRSNE